jgi:hypothetical protein
LLGIDLVESMVFECIAALPLRLFDTLEEAQAYIQKQKDSENWPKKEYIYEIPLL